MTNITDTELLEIKKSIEEDSYLKNLQKYTIFTTIRDFENLQDGPTIKIEDTELNIEFLTRLLTNDQYYDYLYRYLKKEIDNLSLTYIICGDTGKRISYSKVSIYKGLNKLILSGDIHLSPKITERFETLKTMVSFNEFLKKIDSEYYEITIDKKEYKIPIEQIISIMFMPNTEFYTLYNNENEKMINGIPKNHFMYACYDFFSNNNIINDYLVPNDVVKKVQDMENFEVIDLQAINTLLNIEDTLYKEVNIDESLKEKILLGIPNDANPLEKAIYIYIKMCKILTYDDEYFATNQKGQAAIKHGNINYISQISLDNNEVVCYEFNLIYSKLLSELNLNFKSNYKFMVEESYGNGHANLYFRYDKFLIKADSVVSILQGDLVLAKLNQPLIGLWCINQNKVTKKQFEIYMNKMYNLIIEQEKQTKQREINSLEDLIKQYESTTENIHDIDLQEKIDILTDKINTINLASIDSLSYILQLIKIVFDKEKRLNNVSAVIIRNNQPTAKKIASSCLIFTLNQEGFETTPSSNLYFSYIPGHPIVPITKEEIEEKFKEGIFEYIEDDDPKIPGIEFDKRLNQYAALL